MNKRLSTSLATLTAIAAFAVLPAVGQAAEPEYTVNAAPFAGRVYVIGSGEVEIKGTAFGKIVCKTVHAGWIENNFITKRGEGMVVAWTLFACSEVVCPETSPGSGKTFESGEVAENLGEEPRGKELSGKAKGWPSHMKRIVIMNQPRARNVIENVKVTIGCLTGKLKEANVDTEKEGWSREGVGIPGFSSVTFEGVIEPVWHNQTCRPNPSYMESEPPESRLKGSDGEEGNSVGAVTEQGYEPADECIKTT